MAEIARSKIALMSIHPKYVHAILAGTKTVEFRKNGAPRDIEQMVLYATKPDSAILGYCSVKECVIDTPKALWRRFGRNGVITKREFEEYFGGYEEGKCYVLENVARLAKPVAISALKSVSSVPQSFAYLSVSDLRRIAKA